MNIHACCLSRVNGPGLRFTIWTQGCSKGCKECFNPLTWSFENNKVLSPEEILRMVENFEDIDGVTLTGGDPLEQDDILKLLMLLYSKNFKKGIILYTGYTLDEINNSSLLRHCLNYIDVLIDGKFEQNLKIDSSIRGSSNQNIIYFSSKVKPEELLFDHEVEVFLEHDSLGLTGFPHFDRRVLKKLGVILK